MHTGDDKETGGNMPWINESEFYKMDALDQITCATILKWKRRNIVKPLVRREKDGTYSVNVTPINRLEPCGSGGGVGG